MVILAAPSRTVRLAAAGPAQAEDQGDQTHRSPANSAIAPRADETTIAATETLDAMIGAHEAKETAGPVEMVPGAMIAHAETVPDETEGPVAARVAAEATAGATEDHPGRWSVPAHP